MLSSFTDIRVLVRLAVVFLTAGVVAPLAVTSTAAATAAASTRTAAAAPALAGSVGRVVVPTAGSGAVGTAAYPVPAGAIFVDVRRGKDTAAGTRNAPLRTVKAAVKRARSGSTIVMRAGAYHEALGILPANKRLTIQSYPREAVWFDGSQAVTGWKKIGSAWQVAGWRYSFDASTSYTRGDRANGWLNSKYPNAARPDQVFINGVALQQVANKSQVRGATFAVDYASDTITIGLNPAGKSVRATSLSQLMTPTAPGTVLRGFGVRRYATSIPDMGTIAIKAPSARIENVTITDSATTGLHVGKANVVVSHVTVSRSGLLGFHANRADRLTVQYSIFERSNTENFNRMPVSGGMKITASSGVVIRGNRVTANRTHGIWIDVWSRDVKILGNTVRGHGEAGIMVELTQKAVIANNVTIDNRFGIRLIDSGDVRVYNNDTRGSSYFGIELTQDERRATAQSGPGFLLKNISIHNNILTRTGLFQIYVLDKSTGIPADRMGVSITSNLFATRASKSMPSLVGWGGSGNAIGTRFDSVAAIQRAKGWVNLQALTPSPAIAVRNSARAVPIPADMAVLIGQRAGAKRIGNFN